MLSDEDLLSLAFILSLAATTLLFLPSTAIGVLFGLLDEVLTDLLTRRVAAVRSRLEGERGSVGPPRERGERRKRTRALRLPRLSEKTLRLCSFDGLAGSSFLPKTGVPG